MAMLSSCSGHPSLPQKHDRCDEQGGQDGFLRVLRASPPPSCSFLESTGSSGVQMLSFSSNDAAGSWHHPAKAPAFGVLSRTKGSLLLFPSLLLLQPPTDHHLQDVSCSQRCVFFFLLGDISPSFSLTKGLGLSSGASMQGFLARVRGPFTPTQWMELEHQALIYKHIAANAPVPSSLLLPIRRSIHPWCTFGSSSLGWGPFRPGCADVEPGRCRRTDGKKWRCSRDAVGDQKYCEQHINRGRHRSRKHVEGRKATHTIAEPAMVLSGGVSSRSHAVARQQQVKSSAANMTDPFPRKSNRKLLEKQNVASQISASTPMDSFDLSSSHSSPNCDKVALTPMSLHHDHDQAYIAHGVGSLSKGSKSQESRLPVSRETLDDGPLGEVFKSTSCQSASSNILTGKWTESPMLQMAAKFSSVSSSSTVNGGPGPENQITSNGYLTERMVNS